MDIQPKPSQEKIKYGPEERIKMTRLRQTIAKRLKQAQENAAMLTTFNEVDMTNIISMKKKIKKIFKKNMELNWFYVFFVKACNSWFKIFPAINAEIEGE